MEKEIWKDVIGYEGLYQVSNLGKVKRLSVNKLNGRFYSICKEKILKHAVGTNGYYKVVLSNNGKKHNVNIHNLVAESFLNHPRNGTQYLVCNHINFIKTDNRLDNLEIISNRENSNKKHLKSTSKYVGVSWHKTNKKWMSRISVNGKEKYLGLFITELEASKAYKNELHKINL